MPRTSTHPFAAGGRRILRDMFGVAAWKFWRSNPSTPEMLSAGQVFTRDDMTFDERYIQAWLTECDRKLDRIEARGETADASLTWLRDQIKQTLNLQKNVQKNVPAVRPAELSGQAVGASAPQ